MLDARTHGGRGTGQGWALPGGLTPRGRRDTMPDAGKHRLEYFLWKYLADVRRLHDYEECTGTDCPYCEFERQYPGKPYWRTLVAARPPEM